MPEKRFPIQGESVRPPGFDGTGRVPTREAGWVPWGVAEEAYRVYARRYGTGQSLERLAERGGFGWSELISLLRDDKSCPTIPWGKES